MSEVTYLVNPEINTKLNGSKHTVVMHSKGNPRSGSGGSVAYEIRDTTSRIQYYDHAIEGLFEQGFVFLSTLDASLTITLSATFRDAANAYKTGATLWSGTLPANGRMFFMSDKGQSVVETATQKIVDLVELRLPYPAFMLTIKADAIPTVGELQIQNIGRY